MWAAAICDQALDPMMSVTDKKAEKLAHDASQMGVPEAVADSPVGRGQIMLHEVCEVFMAKFGTTLVAGAQMNSIDMYEEVCLIRTKKELAINEGQYLPIGFCKARGFDTDIIEKECTDTKVIRGLGLCYKLVIE